MNINAADLWQIVDSAAEGIWMIDAGGRTTFVNRAMAEMLGCTVVEIHGRLPTDFMFPDDAADHQRRFEARRDGRVERYERRFRRSDGQAVWTSATATPVFDAEHRFAGNFGIFADITARRRNEAVNAARLHLVRFSLTHTLDELLEETLNQVELLTGSQIGFYHFVDADQQSLTLQAWSTRTKSEFCKAEGKGMHYAIAEAGVWTDCVRVRRPVVHNDYASLPHRKGMPEGHAKVVRELVVPVMRGERIAAILGVGNKPADYDDKDAHAVALIADLAWEIAERKRAEAEILRLNDELERRVVERTA